MERWQGCSYRGWVPMPRVPPHPRRDPLIDAAYRMEDPCYPVGFCSPCDRQPKPRFGSGQSPCCMSECELAEARCEEASREECCAQMQMNTECCPIAQDCTPPRTIMKDLPYKTNIILGHFNPDDNKCPDQRERECCDPFWRDCACDLVPYPCRGVIRAPKQKCVTCNDLSVRDCSGYCKGSKYQSPEYLARQGAIQNERLMAKQMEREEMARAKYEEMVEKNQDRYCSENRMMYDCDDNARPRGCF